MNLLQTIAQKLADALNWLNQFWQNFGSAIRQTLALIFREWLDLMWHVLGAIPVPEALANFTWPDVGPLGPVLNALGVPEAFAIISAAGTIKLALSVFRLI